MNIVAITSVDDWMVKLQKELKGCYAKKTIKISELKYPVQVKVDKDSGTFEIYVPKKEEPTTTKKTSKKDKNKKYLYIAGIFVLVCIVGFVIWSNLQ